jgi:hypothetical protein
MLNSKQKYKSATQGTVMDAMQLSNRLRYQKIKASAVRHKNPNRRQIYLLSAR